jgi:hypothetical protein
MPEQPKQAKPRIYGITPTPYEIPAEHLPQQRSPKSKRPLLISIFAVYFLIRAVISLLLALIPWGNPDSDIANYFTANPSLAFGAIPRIFQPGSEMPSRAASALVQGLPFLFLAIGIFSAVLAFKLWTLSKTWRWATMFWSTWSLFSTLRFLVLISVIRSAVPIPLPPIPPQFRAALVLSMAWNLLIVCYLAFYPGVQQAFEGDTA